MSIKVLIADDHEVVRKGLASLLAGSDIKIVAEAKSGEEAVQMAKQHKPDVVMLDIRMQESDGLASLEKLHSDLPKTPVVILSTYDNPTYVAGARSLWGPATMRSKARIAMRSCRPSRPLPTVNRPPRLEKCGAWPGPCTPARNHSPTTCRSRIARPRSCDMSPWA